MSFTSTTTHSTDGSTMSSATSEDDVEEDGAPHTNGGVDGHHHVRPHHNASDSSNPVSVDDDEAYSSASASASDDEDNDDEANGDDDEPLHPPLPPSQHAFAPPFYGRPPTPLPPSPSLTSLLRPSRPTTPDASDDDGAGPAGSSTHGGGGGHHPHHHHPGDPLPRARPKVPTYEYYGFVLYLFSSLSFLIYLLWSYLPSPFLHALGIYYYPNRWWSLAIPSWLVMLLVYIYAALAGYNLEILTLPLENVETIVDEAAQVAVVDEKGRIVRKGRRKAAAAEGSKGRAGGGTGQREAAGSRVGQGRRLNWREVWNEGTDAVMDVPLAGVCEVLYGEGRDWDSELEDGDVVVTNV